MVDLTLIQLLMHKHAKHAKHVSHLRSVKTGQCLVAVQKYLFAIWGLCWRIFSCRIGGDVVVVVICFQ